MKKVVIGATVAGCVVAACLMAGRGIEPSHSVSEGMDYLENNHICANVQGGEELTFLESCGRGVPSRTYTCEGRKKQPVQRTVCFGFFPFRPMYGD